MKIFKISQEEQFCDRVFPLDIAPVFSYKDRFGKAKVRGEATVRLWPTYDPNIEPNVTLNSLFRVVDNIVMPLEDFREMVKENEGRLGGVSEVYLENATQILKEVDRIINDEWVEIVKLKDLDKYLSNKSWYKKAQGKFIVIENAKAQIEYIDKNGKKHREDIWITLHPNPADPAYAIINFYLKDVINFTVTSSSFCNYNGGREKELNDKWLLNTNVWLLNPGELVKEIKKTIEYEQMESIQLEDIEQYLSNKKPIKTAQEDSKETCYVLPIEPKVTRWIGSFSVKRQEWIPCLSKIEICVLPKQTKDGRIKIKVIIDEIKGLVSSRTFAFWADNFLARSLTGEMNLDFMGYVKLLNSREINKKIEEYIEEIEEGLNSPNIGIEDFEKEL